MRQPPNFIVLQVLPGHTSEAEPREAVACRINIDRIELYGLVAPGNTRIDLIGGSHIHVTQSPEVIDDLIESFELPNGSRFPGKTPSNA